MLKDNYCCNLLESITDLFFALDESLKFTYWNRASERLTGVTAEQAVGRSLYELFPDTPQTRELEKVCRQAMETASPRRVIIEYTLEEETFFFELNVFPLSQGVSVLARDITQWRNLENVLEYVLDDSEKRYKELVEHTGDYFWEVNDKMQFIFVSPNIKRLLGYEPEYLINRTPYELMEPVEAVRVKKLIDRFLEREEPFEVVESSVFRQDGSKAFLESSGIPVFDREGKMQGFRGVSRDISERKQREEETARVKVLQAHEKERMRLARELHDEIGMTLTTIKLELQMLENEFFDLDSTGRACAKKLASSIELLNNSLRAVRNKSAFLRPPDLDELGFTRAIDTMVKDVSLRTGFKARFHSSGEAVSLTPEVETALYRCVQEALTNTARHASAQNTAVELIWDQESIRLRVADDGIGFDLDGVKNSRGCFGLQGMEERVFLLRGRMEINTSAGQGAEIVIAVPYGENTKGGEPNASPFG